MRTRHRKTATATARAASAAAWKEDSDEDADVDGPRMRNVTMMSGESGIGRMQQQNQADDS